MPRLHPNLDLLSEYSAGALGAAQNVAVSAHLHFCDKCRDHVYSLEEVGGCLVEQADAQPVSNNMLDAVLARIEETETGSAARVQATPMQIDIDLKRLPASVQRLLPAGRRQWRHLSPSLEVAQIPVGECRFELSLHKIKAGRRAPQHDHKGLEITVVLQGSFSDDDGVYQQGDFVVREPGEVHTPMATRNDECICLSACEAPIRMTGTFSRMLNPFLRFDPA